MGSTKVEICNMALGAIGVSDEIENLDTERSAEAIACRRFYRPVLEEVLREFNWPFARKVAGLGLIEENPNDEYLYSYRYPTDCVAARRILSGFRSDTTQTRVPTRMYVDGSGKLIYTDKADAELEYTALTDNPSFYPPDFASAVAHLLGVRIAPSVTAGDDSSSVERAQENYDKIIAKAKAAAANEESDDVEADPEVLRGYQ